MSAESVARAAASVDSSTRDAWPARAFWTLAGAGAWLVLLIAAWLEPDPRGFGSHQQLGLPPCMFEAFAHFPCPGCGLTTSFANMAHGHVIRAFQAHLMGPALCALTQATALCAPWTIRRAVPLTRVLASPATTGFLAVTLALGLITFALRLGRHFLAGA